MENNELNSGMKPRPESLYRTRWLMAHNCVHDLIHIDGIDPKTRWEEYLAELKTAEQVSSVSA